MCELSIQPNLKIQFEISSGKEKRRYSSRIEKIDQTSVSISYPVSSSGEKVKIQVGMKCRVAFFLRENTYAFDTQIVDIQSTPSQLVVLSRPSTFYDWKRRHLRLDTGVWVRYTVVQREEMRKPIDQPVRSYTQTLDISGGGILVQPPHPLAIGTILELEIDIPAEPEPILAIGQVAHIRESAYGIEFLIIEETDRDKIVKYIFETERTSRGNV